MRTSAKGGPQRNEEYETRHYGRGRETIETAKRKIAWNETGKYVSKYKIRCNYTFIFPLLRMMLLFYYLFKEKKRTYRTTEVGEGEHVRSEYNQVRLWSILIKIIFYLFPYLSSLAKQSSTNSIWGKKKDKKIEEEKRQIGIYSRSNTDIESYQH